MKMLFIDIETSPNIVYSWCVGRKINLTPDNIIQERQIICICYKWADEKKVQSIDWGKKQNDKQLLKDISKVLLEADIVIAQNGDRYDLRFINGRLAYHGLPPVGELSTIDTLKQSRKAFFINSHKLDYMGQFFGLGRKLETGFGLWKDVMQGDEKALADMIKYCKQDVLLLEKVYQHITPYAPQKLRIGELMDNGKLSCPACGSTNGWFNGYRIHGAKKYRRRICHDCAHPYRVPLEKNKEAIAS